MDKIEKIRAEIERRLNILTNVYAEQVERKDEEMMNYYHGKVIALEELRPFLDTLSEEPDKSLEEAAKGYSSEPMYYLDGKRYDTRKYNAFIAGAEWQASQMPMPEDTVLFNKGVEEGRRLEREDSVECMSNILVPDDLATNEEIKKMLQERRAMIEKEVQRRVFNEVEHCWEEAHHEGYVEGWNECEAAYKSK